jgi:hypothetical protein
MLLEISSDAECLTPTVHRGILGHMQRPGNILDIARFPENQGTYNSDVYPVPSSAAVENRKG